MNSTTEQLIIKNSDHGVDNAAMKAKNELAPAWTKAMLPLFEDYDSKCGMLVLTPYSDETFMVCDKPVTYDVDVPSPNGRVGKASLCDEHYPIFISQVKKNKKFVVEMLQENETEHGAFGKNKS
jgi:hypothetical protein